MLLIFAVGILFDVARRYTYGSDPIGATMMVMSAVAAVINYVCLRLLQLLDEPVMRSLCPIELLRRLLQSAQGPLRTQDN